ncbi:MAG: ABC transporter ATP-binding protein [Desulfobulbaceae bacterium]|nr:ABC transporter ATP-binding protein [Desulfobulbaceae bacterium]
MNSSNPEILLQAEDIHKTYGTGRSMIHVLRGIDVTVGRGEMVAVVGASGSGKTTLLQILGTLDVPTQGVLAFEGRSLATLGEKELSIHRNRNVGFIFQFHHLLPEFSALENVMIPGMIRGEDKQKLTGRAEALLEQVNLGHRLQHRSGELSGGEQQRVALARALIMHPSLLLADEPTGNLDSKSGRMVFELLHKMSRDRGLSVVMVTHNEMLAQAMDRRLTLQDGVLG